ncbi:helix-turn-helix transcriptional regulator [Streptomyces sp. NPDC004237]|uniref:AraC family transcriptional regulator n=1 Tax=Streptomyces sp. NPDC004237 TaxID=3154455 RepID=UPI00339E471F
MDGIEEWRRICAESFLGDHVRPVMTDAGFDGEVRRRWVDDSLVIRLRTTTPYHAKYRRGADGGDYVGFLTAWPPARESIRWRDGSSVENVQAAAGIWDNGAIEELTVHTPKEQTCIFVPKDALKAVGFRLGRFATPVMVDHKPTARVLAGILDSVLSQPGDLALADAVSIRNAALGLLAGTAPEDLMQTSGAVSEAMKQRVEAWVAGRLAKGQVSPVDAAAAHGISVRSLHRLFSESEGTFGDMVRALRLERARQDLALSGSTVQAIASRWGYADVSHFCREFKRSYGMTTTEFRNQHPATPIAS